MLCRVVASAVLFSLFAQSTALARPIRFTTARTTASGISHTEHVAVGDFNHDGNLDLVISSTFNQVAVFLGNGDGTFTGPTIYNLTFYVTGSVAVGDFNGDGKLDLAVVGGDTSGHGLAFLSGNGDGSFNPPVYFQTTLSGSSLTVLPDDFNHDHNLDLFVGGNGASEVILGDGLGNFQNGQLESVYGDGIVIGDFNHDGNLDVASTQPYPYYNSTGVSVLLGNGDGTFQPSQAYSGMESPYAIATGDFNGDKKLDLAASDYIFNTVVILQGNGDGTFTNVGQWFAGINPGAIAVSDFNLDSKADLAVSDYGGGVSVLPGKGDCTFPSSLNFAAGAGPSDLVAVDLNHDGSPDLVVINNVDDTFSVLLNAAGTHVRLTSSPNPSAPGQTVTFTVKVLGSVTSSHIPSGNVVFRDGTSTLGSAALTAGSASFTISTLSQGTHSIVATYAGDSNFNPGRSPVELQKVK